VRRAVLFCGALLGLSALFATAQRQAGRWALLRESQLAEPGQDPCCDFEGALERAEATGRPALILVSRAELPLVALQCDVLRDLEEQQSFVLGLADAERHAGLVREVLGRPAAMAMLALDSAGTPVAAQAGFVSARDAARLLLQARESLPQLEDSELSRVALARELLSRGLEARGERLLRELLEAELAPPASAATRELQFRHQLARGEVRAAQELLEELSEQAAALSSVDWAYDQAACAFARRELARALEILESLEESALPCAALTLKARVLHELGRDVEAAELLDGPARDEWSPLEALRFEQARLHLLEDPHGHDH
jgi:hypothetical protein